MYTKIKNNRRLKGEGRMHPTRGWSTRLHTVYGSSRRVQGTRGCQKCLYLTSTSVTWSHLSMWCNDIIRQYASLQHTHTHTHCTAAPSNIGESFCKFEQRARLTLMDIYVGTRKQPGNAVAVQSHEIEQRENRLTRCHNMKNRQIRLRDPWQGTGFDKKIPSCSLMPYLFVSWVLSVDLDPPKIACKDAYSLVSKP